LHLEASDIERPYGKPTYSDPAIEDGQNEGRGQRVEVGLACKTPNTMAGSGMHDGVRVS
jgi:hypothetical protein